jgi:hypothetical protein
LIVALSAAWFAWQFSSARQSAVNPVVQAEAASPPENVPILRATVERTSPQIVTPAQAVLTEPSPQTGSPPLPISSPSATPEKRIAEARASVPPGAPTRFRGELRDNGSKTSFAVPVNVELDATGMAGTITYGSRLGDTTVRFVATRYGGYLQAVTKDVIAKPVRVKWEGEVFGLRFSPDETEAAYECEIPKSGLRGKLRRQ